MSDGAGDGHIGWEAGLSDGSEYDPEPDWEPDLPPDPGVWPPPPTSGPLSFGTAPTCWWHQIPQVLLALPGLTVVFVVVLAGLLTAALIAFPIIWVRRKVREPLRRRRRRAKERRAGVEWP